MSASLGFSFLDPLVNAHLADMSSVAALIRTRSMHSSSQHTDGIGINSNISPQVNVEKETAPVPQRVLGEAFCISRLVRIRKLAGN